MSACCMWLTRFASLLILSHTAYAKEPAYVHLDVSEHAYPEKVVQYLKNAPEKKKKIAEDAYEHAQHHAARGRNTSWGSVYKSCMESISLYPTGKAFLLGIEARLKHLAEVDKRKPPAERGFPAKVLQQMAGQFDSAIAVESHERSLDDSRRDQLVLHRDCLKRYIDTNQAEADCVPLQWAGIVPVK